MEKLVQMACSALNSRGTKPSIIFIDALNQVSYQHLHHHFMVFNVEVLRLCYGVNDTELNL